MRSILHGIRGYLDRRVLLLTALGFGSGVPLLLVLSTLTVWLEEAGLTKAGIAFFSWVGLAWAWKFLWAPVVDRVKIPGLHRWLGHRRAWMLVSQFAIMGGVLLLSTQDPTQDIRAFALSAALLAFFSATHDISLDAWRVQVLDADMQGNGASTYQLGYRLAMLATGAGALALASVFRQDSETAATVARGVVDTASGLAATLSGTEDSTSFFQNLHMARDVWPKTYRFMSLLMIPAILATLFAPEPKDTITREDGAEPEEGSDSDSAPIWERYPEVDWLSRVKAWPKFARDTFDATLGPFVEFLYGRGSVAFALLVLTFVLTFRLSDSIAGTLMNPFLIELGFEYTQIARIQKVFGFAMTIVGTFVGGALFRSMGAKPTLWVAGFLQVFSNLMFVYQANVGADPVALHLTISVENLSGGLVSGAFVAYLSNLCSHRYSATQYALLSALAMVGRIVIAGSTGFIADNYGWDGFFIFSTVAGIPGLLLLWKLSRDPRGFEGQPGGGVVGDSQSEDQLRTD
jgi:PAT family beta-lactamase induction signal transducer AmpG